MFIHREGLRTSKESEHTRRLSPTSVIEKLGQSKTKSPGCLRLANGERPEAGLLSSSFVGPFPHSSGQRMYVAVEFLTPAATVSPTLTSAVPSLSSSVVGKASRNTKSRSHVSQNLRAGHWRASVPIRIIISGIHQPHKLISTCLRRLLFIRIVYPAVSDSLENLFDGRRRGPLAVSLGWGGGVWLVVIVAFPAIQSWES